MRYLQSENEYNSHGEKGKFILRKQMEKEIVKFHLFLNQL